MFELVDNIPQSAVIKVIGVGGGGGNDRRLRDRAGYRAGDARHSQLQRPLAEDSPS